MVTKAIRQILELLVGLNIPGPVLSRAIWTGVDSGCDTDNDTFPVRRCCQVFGVQRQKLGISSISTKPSNMTWCSDPAGCTAANRCKKAGYAHFSDHRGPQ